jgi:hypothetical protein
MEDANDEAAVIRLVATEGASLPTIDVTSLAIDVATETTWLTTESTWATAVAAEANTMTLE